MDRNEALRRLLDIAYDVQFEWIVYGRPEKDYRDELKNAAQSKAAFYRECAKIEAELMRLEWPNRWTVLSNELLTRVFGQEYAEKQQVTDGEGDGDSPETPAPRFELGK